MERITSGRTARAVRSVVSHAIARAGDGRSWCGVLSAPTPSSRIVEQLCAQATGVPYRAYNRGDTVYETDVAVEFDDDRAHYHVLIPLNGCLESRYRGQPLTSTPTLASIYRPDAEMAATWWPGGSRHLAVKLDQVAVDRALEALVQGRLDSAIEFDPALPLTAGAAQEWVRLLILVHRQLENPDSMVGNSLVLAPLVESLIHGFLLVADHPYRESLATPAEPGRPAAVGDAMGLIEAEPHLPLTTSQLAMQCHVSVRSLQEGFRKHLGMSPMAYLREVRLRRAHSDSNT